MYFGTFKFIGKPANLLVTLTTFQHMWERKGFLFLLEIFLMKNGNK